MKIERISISNFLGARAIDLVFDSPVQLMCGPNGAGKSSVRDGIALALTADLGRVGLKKDAPQLITDGADGANVVLQTSAGEVAVAIAASGRIADSLKGVELPPALPYVLDGQRFARMTPEERRGFLFGLMGLSAGGDEVRKRLAARGCDVQRAEAVMPMLRAGFDAAAKEAATKAREAKASWREITGETYGEKKAEGWRPALVNFDEKQLRAAEAALEATEAGLEAANQRLGKLQLAQTQHRQAEQRAAGLREKAGRRQRITEKLKLDRAELAEWEPKLARVQAAAQPKVGLVHDLARATDSLLREFASAGYGGETEVHEEARAALGAYEREHGPLAKTTAHDAEVAPKLQQYEKAVALYRSAVANGERDLAEADAAAVALEQLDAGERAPDQAEVDAAARHRDDLKAEKGVNAAKVAQLRAAEREERQAVEKIKRATAAHQSVVAWAAIADALGPGGIPGEILTEALDPLNERLAQSALDTEWMQVGVDGEMQISVGSAGRPYALLSESEKWRVDAMLAEAIAHLSGLRMLVLDRMDVLDLQGRQDLLAWLDNLAEDGELDTCLLFATLKGLPASLPPTMSAHWIEGGVVTQLKEAA